MRRILLGLLCLGINLACNAAPACADTSIEADGVGACTASGAPAVYCTCTVRKVMDDYSCHDINTGNVPFKAVTDACIECGGGNC